MIFEKKKMKIQNDIVFGFFPIPIDATKTIILNTIFYRIFFIQMKIETMIHKKQRKTFDLYEKRDKTNFMNIKIRKFVRPYKMK